MASNVDIASLSPQERLELIEELWDSLAADSGSVPITDAQRAELDSRLHEIDAGDTAGIPWNEVVSRILDRS